MEQTIKIMRTRMYEFSVDLAKNEWRFDMPDGGEPLLAARSAFILSPAVPDVQIRGTKMEEFCRTAAGCRKIRITGGLSGAVSGEVVNEVFILADRIICEAWYRAQGAHALEYWTLSPDGGSLSAEKIHVYAAKHGERDENGTILSAANADLSTKTHNWTYANAAPRILFYRGRFGALFGGTRLANDFGMELKTENGRIRHFWFNYGGRLCPQRVCSDEVVRGPRLQIDVSLSLGHDEAHAKFTRSMINDGIVPAKQYQPEDFAWRRPWYCTWGDQTGIAKSTLRQDQSGKAEYAAIKDVLTQDMVLKTAKLIRKKNLNIGTIIIDDGWQDKRGDWNLAADKFPDMRGLVNELHAMDFKAVIWWAPFLTEPDAQILKRPGFVTGPTPYHKEMVVDYTNPDVRKWICAKLETWFSNGPQGWDTDGLKLDFLAEKIYPETHASDSEWRGEERCFYKLFELVAAHLRKHKVSPGLLHVPYNPHYMRFAAAVHGEERFDRDVKYLPSRQALVEAMIPGTWSAPHFNYNMDVVPDFIRGVKRVGGIVQIGKLVGPDVTPSLIAEMRELLRDAQ